MRPRSHSSYVCLSVLANHVCLGESYFWNLEKEGGYSITRISIICKVSRQSRHGLCMAYALLLFPTPKFWWSCWLTPFYNDEKTRPEANWPSHKANQRQNWLDLKFNLTPKLTTSPIWIMTKKELKYLCDTEDTMIRKVWWSLPDVKLLFWV